MVVAIPKELFLMLGHTRAEVVEALKVFSVLGLYQEHKISAGKAAELLGMGKREFIRLLARRGVAYFDYSDEEMAEERRVFDEWQREITSG